MDPAQGSFADLLLYPTEAERLQPSPAQESSPDAPVSLAHASLPVFRVQLVREGEQPLSARPQISAPQDAATIFRDYLQDRDREYLVVLMLDTKNRMIGLHTVSIGTLDSALVSSREVFKAAILSNARSIIVAHNHPSGDPTPSPEDQQITRKLHEAGALLNIQVLDHLVIGERGTFKSLKEMGML